VTKVLLEAGASLSAVDYEVIKHSVKLNYIFNISISFILDDIPHVSLKEFNI
jgi:hypothetical protein